MSAALEPQGDPNKTAPAAPPVTEAVEPDPAILDTTGPETGRDLVPVDSLPRTELKTFARKSTALATLGKLKGEGPTLVAQAEALAATVTLQNSEPLFDHSQPARAKISEVANMLIGDRRFGEVDPVMEIFKRFSAIHAELNPEGLKQEPGLLAKALEALPDAWGPQFAAPIKAFLMRFEGVRKEIDEKEEELKGMEVQHIETRTTLNAMKKSMTEALRTYQVGIAAGEVALDRELARLDADIKDAAGVDDPITLDELRQRRQDILNVDNRVLSLWTEFGDAMVKLPLITDAQTNAEKLRMSARNMWVTTIPMIRSSVALVLVFQDQEQAAELMGGQEKLNQALREANIDLAGKAQLAVHELAIMQAKAVDHLVESMGKVLDHLKEGIRLTQENFELNQKAREKFTTAQESYTAGLHEVMRGAAGVSPKVQ